MTLPLRADEPSAAVRGNVLAFPAALSIVIAAFALFTRQPMLQRTFVGAGVLLLAWCGVVWHEARTNHRTLTIAFAPHRHHWVQACAQSTLILYWAANTPLVAALLPLIVAQIAFAYAFNSLQNWSKRDIYPLGFAPLPVVLSINLFLQFRPEWFYWQFALIALGFTAKESIRWQRDGRLAHIFNPSSFPLAVVSVVLLVGHATHLTFGNEFANTIFDTPHIHLVIFLVALPAQILFGVAPVTIAAALTLYGIGLAYLAATGTYLFYDAYIPPAVFIGMTLLVTDPATSPRTELGRIIFGILYGIGTAVLFVWLERAGAPTFYDKLLPIPIMNLMVRAIDRFARAPVLTQSSFARWRSAFTQRRTNVVYTSAWVLIFLPMLAFRAVGDSHEGQYLPFWHNACVVGGSSRACNYMATLTSVYCQRGSGWACNDVAILRRRIGAPAAKEFQRACELGFAPGCENANRDESRVDAFGNGPPELRDLPILLSGTKPTLKERDPAKLRALACVQGWPGACAAAGGMQ